MDSDVARSKSFISHSSAVCDIALIRVPNSSIPKRRESSVVPHTAASHVGRSSAPTQAGEQVRFRTRKAFALLIRLAVEAGRSSRATT